jgi:hypothetical protein
MRNLAPFLFLAVLALGACGGKVTPAPQPFRPKVVDTGPTDPPPTTAPADCEPVKESIGALSYGERSIPESEALTKLADTSMASADGQGIDQSTREQLFIEAVERLVQALVADPYNVNATYALAAAYAKIDRQQCSLNMLERLIQMRSHPSKKAAVDAKLDVLLGRRKQAIDTSFKNLRADPRFRELISGICAGTDDPGCVMGR